MSDHFTILQQEDRVFWIQRCPVILGRHTVLKDKEHVFTRCVYKNVGKVSIKELHTGIAHLDTAKKLVIEPFHDTGISIGSREIFEQEIPLHLPLEQENCAVSVIPQKIVFENDAVWENQTSEPFTLAPPYITFSGGMPAQPAPVRQGSVKTASPKPAKTAPVKTAPPSRDALPAPPRPVATVRTVLSSDAPAGSKSTSGGKKAVIALLCVLLAAGAVAAASAVWRSTAADDAFAATLEQCVTAHYNAWTSGSIATDEARLALEDGILSYQGKRFHNKELKDACDQYINGLSDQKTALEGEKRNNRLWREGFLARCQVVKTMQENGSIHLPDDMYMEYAMEVLKNDLRGKIVGQYNSPQIHTAVVNTALCDLNRVSATVDLYWAGGSDSKTFTKEQWLSGESWDIAFELPSEVFENAEDTLIDLQMEYKIAEKNEDL